MRTIHEISHHLVSLEETLRNRFIPAITGTHICNDNDRKLLPLPTRFGGIAIPIFYEQAALKYSNSRKLIAQLAPLIKNQIKQYTVDKTQIKITKQFIKKEKQDRCQTSLDHLRNNLSEKSKRLRDVSIEKGASNWLTAPPISDFGFELSKQNLWDAIRLRYGWSIANLPTTCPCRFSVQCCMSCKKKGFVSIRHNYLKDLTANMLSEVCKDIEIKPKLTPLTGEVLGSRTANTTNEARLEIRARGVWERGLQAFLDWRVFDPNVYRYLNKSLQQYHLMNEQERKRAYNERVLQIEHGTFAPLLFFNLWKYGEGMPYVLFKIIRFIVRETWFTKNDNHEVDTNKNMLCFVEIQLSLPKRLWNSVQKGSRVWEWCCCFWIHFSNLKACVIVFVK